MMQRPAARRQKFGGISTMYRGAFKFQDFPDAAACDK
jgi:hypothetical protein